MRPVAAATAAVVLITCTALAAATSGRTDARPWYLFTSFRGNGEDGLHLACSRDGYSWTELGGGKPFLAPKIGPKPLMRDPCIRRGPDGTFHMVWTTTWTTPVLIGYASSKDLVRWSEQKGIPVMEGEPDARNAWAPELFHDETGKQWLICWSTTIPGRFPETDKSGDGGHNHRMYYKTTPDFQTFSKTRLFYDGGFNVIDGTILKAGRTYRLIVKDETRNPVRKNLRIATGPTPEGPWSKASEPFTLSWVEGPSAIRIGQEYLVYFDHYANPHYYGAARSRDLVTWEDVSRKMAFPKGHRHGTVIEVPREVVERLLKHTPK